MVAELDRLVNGTMALADDPVRPEPGPVNGAAV